MPVILTVGEHVAWSYANLARAHAALTEGCLRYRTHHHMIRAKLYKGLCAGTMQIGSLIDDERIKLTMPSGCAYCGQACKPTLDHLIPRARGGDDSGDNIIVACGSCNSSKGERDMLVWHRDRSTFPSLMLLRRYLKIVARHCTASGLMAEPLGQSSDELLPFALSALPYNYPALSDLKLWATGR